jgi:hypothetical protein
MTRHKAPATIRRRSWTREPWSVPLLSHYAVSPSKSVNSDFSLTMLYDPDGFLSALAHR